MAIRCVIFVLLKEGRGAGSLTSFIPTLVACGVSVAKHGREGAFSSRAFGTRNGALRAWTDCAVIHICYENFAAGTHEMTGLYGRAERSARGVTLYLLPGLTTRQRRAVIRRLRQEASRGFGPPLPLPQLAIALGLDRVRAAVRIAGGLVRLHPAVTLLPSALMVAVMALFVIASSDGPGGAPRTRVGLAETAPAGSGEDALAPAAQPVPVRMARAAIGMGAVTGTGGGGLGTGLRAPARHLVAQRPHGSAAARLAARSTGTWYICPQPMAALAPRRSCDSQPACRRASSWAVSPYTAHLPGPQDLAR